MNSFNNINNRSAVSFIQSMVTEKMKKNCDLSESSKLNYCMHTDYQGDNGHIDQSAMLMAAHEDSHMNHYVPPTWADYQNESGGRHGDEHIDREY